MRSLAVLVACLTAPALAQHVDVGAVVNGGQIETWAADHDLGIYLNPERVFEGEMNLISGSVVGDEPGYFFLPNSQFAGQFVGFDIRRAVRAWDPLAPSSAPNTNFLSIPTSSITFGDSVLGFVTTPAADPAVPLPGLQVQIPGAGLDFHYPMTLNLPTEGIYLVELEMRTSLAGILDSQPYWMVLNYGLDEPEHERAVEYVQQFIVPAPGSLAIVAGGLVLIRRTRRTS